MGKHIGKIMLSYLIRMEILFLTKFPLARVCSSTMREISPSSFSNSWPENASETTATRTSSIACQITGSVQPVAMAPAEPASTANKQNANRLLFNIKHSIV